MSGPVPLRQLMAWLDETLMPPAGAVRDYGPNGLQVEGRPQCRRVALGVTSNLALIDAAAAWGADLLVVHHGILWEGAPLPLTGALGRRVGALMAAGMSLAGYHLPLDAHPTLGNAATLARQLGASAAEPDFEHRGLLVGCVASLRPPLAVAALLDRVRERVSPHVHVFPHGPDPITRLGIVTGGAARDVRRAIDLGCDAYLTGEAGEYSQATAAEERITFIAAGHHRTERFGPQALAGALADRWPGLEVRFIDVDNPV